MNKNNFSIIISCAGMGTRLGAGVPKSLIDICGKPLIIRQLETLSEYDDIRIVVGYQADRVIDVVKKFRKDVKFFYNFDYATTGTASSFSKGLVDAREYSVALDGDLLVNPHDLKAFLNYDGECIGGCIPTTDNPVLMELNSKGQVIEFSRKHGQLEWTGLAKIKTNKLVPNIKHVYMMLEPLMPIDVVKISSKEIDTVNDYENAKKWFINNCEE